MCQEPLNHFYSKEMIELDLVLVDYSLRSDNGGSFFSSVVGFFFFGPSNSLFATFCCCMAFRRKMAKSWQPPKNMWLVMSASLRHPIDLSASLYGTDSYSAREKKKKHQHQQRRLKRYRMCYKKKKKSTCKYIIHCLDIKSNLIYWCVSIILILL